MPPAVLFSTPADFIAAVFGPSQHDAHCQSRRRHLFLAERRAAWQRAVPVLEAEMARIKAVARADRNVFQQAAE